MTKKYSLILLLILIISISLVLIKSFKSNLRQTSLTDKAETPEISETQNSETGTSAVPLVSPKTPEKTGAASLGEFGLTIHKVPFVAQAPRGNWADKRQQDGCEEASVYMAVKWARSEKVSTDKKFLEKEIIAMADFEKEKYGFFADTSASSTAKMLLKGYFNFNDFTYKENIRKEDLIKEVQKGNIVIIPADGRALKNPNFSNGGPDRHMLVVIGYDPAKREFIANDPGTRQGRNYRYKENLLYDAIRDYMSGDHEPIIGEKKNAIIIYKN